MKKLETLEKEDLKILINETLETCLKYLNLVDEISYDLDTLFVYYRENKQLEDLPLNNVISTLSVCRRDILNDICCLNIIENEISIYDEMLTSGGYIAKTMKNITEVVNTGRVTTVDKVEFLSPILVILGKFLTFIENYAIQIVEIIKEQDLDETQKETLQEVQECLELTTETINNIKGARNLSNISYRDYFGEVVIGDINEDDEDEDDDYEDEEDDDDVFSSDTDLNIVDFELDN